MMRYGKGILLKLLIVPLLMGSAPEAPRPVGDAAILGPAALAPMPRHRPVARERLLAMASAAAPAPGRRCIAQAVYFEARGEPVAGQFAVAHVVLNRMADPRYPDTACGVVFQNEGWRHRCQFSFACDGLSDRPKDARAWLLARTVAALAEMRSARGGIEAATHYHADYVRPRWAERLERAGRLGRHIFYRQGF